MDGYRVLLLEQQCCTHVEQPLCWLCCTQIYCCLRLVGFNNSGYLRNEDQAVVVFIQQYVKFRQGEVWQQIKAEFEAAGMDTADEDRYSIAAHTLDVSAAEWCVVGSTACTWWHFRLHHVTVKQGKACAGCRVGLSIHVPFHTQSPSVAD